jgi:hypothetical protein
MTRPELVVAAHSRDADDCRLLLDILGLLPRPVSARPAVTAHQVHGRGPGRYVAGCRKCAETNRRYVAAWRRRRGCAAVTTRGNVVFVVLDRKAGRGRQAAYPGQLALEVSA